MGDGPTQPTGWLDASRDTLVRLAESLDTESTITRLLARDALPGRGEREGEELAETAHALPLIVVDRSPAPDSSRSGPDAVAEFTVLSKLGQGGMGRVDLARQRSLDRDVAVKTLRRDQEGRYAAIALLHEARVTGQLEHPNIVPVHQLGVDETGRPVLVMKRIEGVSWQTLIKDPDHPWWQRAFGATGERSTRHLAVFLDVCKAVHFAHTRGVLHRDIKPSNVMIGEQGEVYVVDWGLATKAGTSAFAHVPSGAVGVPLGTPTFMAPEMVSEEGDRLDERTDVYLLGATLHYALTGRSRHPGGDLLEVLESVRASRACEYPGAVPPELAEVCNRATSRRPEDRYQTALAIRGAVASYLEHQGSRELAAAADERRVRLFEVLGRADHEKAHVEALRLFAEIRFAYQQALREWPDNQRARVGLQECLERMIEHQLRREADDAAAALVAELPEARPLLTMRLAALRQRFASERRRVEGLERMADDLDLSVAGRQRPWLFLACGVTGVACGLAFLPVGGHPLLEPTHANAVLVMVVFTAVALVATAVGRRALMQNLANRRVVFVLFLGCCGVLTNRGVAWALDVPLGHMLVTDMLVASAVAVGAGITVDRAISVVGIAFLLGVLAGVLAPDAARPIFTLTQVLAFTLAAVVWVRRRRRLERPSET